MVITHSGNRNWEITDVRSHCGNLQVRLDPAQRTPGMVRYRMLVRMDGEMPDGDIRERLTLICNDRDFPTTEMAISGRIRPAVSISPASVSPWTISRIAPSLSTACKFALIALLLTKSAKFILGGSFLLSLVSTPVALSFC